MSLAPNSPSSRLVPIAGAVLIALAGIVVYLPALQAGFIWNDEDLTGNIVLQKDGLFRVWFTTESLNYWPLVWTSYWLEYQLWGLQPAGYHAVNILLHAISSILVWRVLLRLNVPGAWLAALIFAVHPVNVESVAWVTQRKNCLSLLFALISLLLFLRHDDRGGRGVAWGAVFVFWLALLSKGAAVALPVVLLLCIWWRRGRVRFADVLRTVPFFILALAMSLVEIWFQYVRAIGDDVVRDDSFLARLTGAGWVVWFYLWKAFWPLQLSFVYPRWQIDPSNWLAHVPNLALVAVLLIAWRFRSSWGRAVLFALASDIVLLAPVLGFFNIYFMRYSFVADHYQYLAIIAPIALVTAGGTLLVRQWHSDSPLSLWETVRVRAPGLGQPSPRPSPRGRGGKNANRCVRLAQVFAAGVVFLLGGLSWQQTYIYENNETLWLDTIRKNPECWLAHYNLGNLLRDQNRLDEAAVHLEQAIRLQPDDAWAHNNLADVRQRQQRVEEALEHYRVALQFDPTLVEAAYNLGILHQQRGELAEAAEYYREALRLAPRFAEAHNNLGLVLERLGQPAAAIMHFQESLRQRPDNAQAHFNLGRLLLQTGDRSTATAHLREAARLDPRLATASLLPDRLQSSGE